MRVKFPTPSMPDGLDAARQKAVVEKLIGGEYSYAEFTRRSTVAPHLLKLRDILPSDPKAPARGVDIWFVAYGDLKSLDDEKFMERMLNAGRGEGKTNVLKNEDLAKRKITVGDDKREGYVYLELDFLEKVRLKAAGRGYWSRTDESALVAGVIDPRFLRDPEFPNQWQSLNKMSGTLKVSPPSEWSGAAFYLKITRLHEPAGASSSRNTSSSPNRWAGSTAPTCSAPSYPSRSSATSAISAANGRRARESNNCGAGVPPALPTTMQPRRLHHKNQQYLPLHRVLNNIENVPATSPFLRRG